ncbi:hypothetical protein B9Z65_24 [Elsinoe australis]|uniref:Endosomal peripheral membrane protein n=1 Tax=Elsinoe australis TaxID=40998 RepID=A0A2P7YWI7_9PEZI|nr:hypothetical protein B9Z65_24 [Elsinoe australis]
MSGQILAIELTAISQEAKRKHADIRTAADKSLQVLKSLPSTSEQQLAADLSRKASFIDPFVQGAVSRNARLANSSIVCLQRLIVIKGLPPSRLKDVLEGFNASTSLSLDIQLKILQALPGLAQNYADHLTGSLLAAALRVCAALQHVKVPTVSAVAVATLQQLVVLVFDKVAMEDVAAKQSESPPIAEVDGEQGPITLRQAAFDAYRVLQDIAKASQGERAEFLDLSNFAANIGLELVHAILTSHGGTFSSHLELVKVLKDQVVPFLIRLLSDRQSFPITLRAMRIVPMVIQRHVRQMSEECEIMLGLLTHLMDPDSSPPWKRTMVMEVFRSIYTTPGLVVQLYMQYDQHEGKKAIVRDNISSFVRLSTEKPALIGLGQQSTVPIQQGGDDGDVDFAAVEAAGGPAGVISSTVTESSALGVSSLWSTPKVQVLDLLDKSDAPPFPETYIYSLTLECLNSLSDNLAKVILPLTMSQDTPSKRRPRQYQVSHDDADGDRSESPQKKSGSLQRSQSYRSSTMPVNPLTLDKIPAAPRVKAIAELLEGCWPALLATSSTFLYSALDNDFYRGLIRSVQRFTQVAGLLDIVTARDAFLTTLGKAAVPPNLISSLSFNVPQSPSVNSPNSFLNSKSMLSVNSALGGQQSNNPAMGRRPSHEPQQAMLSTRNLLCLRALVNLAIALGPTLKDSFAIILGTLQHADLYLEYMQQSNSSASLAPLGHEIEAVRAAAKRLLESTADYPNESFKSILDIFCRSIDDDVASQSAVQSPIESRRPSGSDFSRRIASISVVQSESPLRASDRYILLSKTGRLADLNTTRFASYRPSESGWQRLAECLISAAVESALPRESRMIAADILCRSATSLIADSTGVSSEETTNVQKLALTSIDKLVRELFEEGFHLGPVDIAIYCKALDAIRNTLEASGESLITGWDIVLRTVKASFRGLDQKDDDSGDESEPPLNLSVDVMKPNEDANAAHADPEAQLIAPEAGRIAFSVTQIVCSDFLASLKSSYLITVSDILHKFARQRSDVNMSLTAITLFSEVSTFLLRDNARSALESIASPQTDRAPQKIYESLRRNEKDSRAAQWIILLHQLSEVASDDRSDIRNGAFQMLLRILLDQSLDPHAFQFAFTSVLLKTLEDNANRQTASGSANVKEKSADSNAADEASRSLLEGVAKYLAQNIDTFEKTTQFGDTWSKWMDIMHKFLGLKSHAVNSAVFSAIATILSSVQSANGDWPTAIGQVGSLWGSSIPTSLKSTDQDGQQAAFRAYVACASELVRLTSTDVTASQIRSISQNSVRCVRESLPERYGNDENSTTPLQAAVLEVLRSLRSDVDDAPAILVKIAADLLQLPFEGFQKTTDEKRRRPTFVALSKGSMDWLIELVEKHASSFELYKSDSVNAALKALAVPIQIKYHWSKPGKPPPPWKKATSTALQILPLIVPQLWNPSISQTTTTPIWTSIITLGSAIIHGDYSPLSISSSFADTCTVEADEHSDAASLFVLRTIILPHLGASTIPPTIRSQYCHALFSASIVHPLRPSLKPLLAPSADPTTSLLTPLKPSVHDPSPSRREDLAYLCLAELIGMASSSPRGFVWHDTSTFTDPYTPGSYGNEGSEEKRNLARAAMPWLLARVAVVLKGYVADQPLRPGGLMPISLREEVVWVLQRVGELRCVEACFGEEGDGKGTKGDALLHLRRLHPLLVRAVGVAGHARYGNEEILGALMGVLDVFGKEG